MWCICVSKKKGSRRSEGYTKSMTKINKHQIQSSSSSSHRPCIHIIAHWKRTESLTPFRQHMPVGISQPCQWQSPHRLQIFSLCPLCY